MRKIALTFGLIFAGFLLTPRLVEAAIVSKHFTRVYEVGPDSTKVTETLTTSLTDPTYLISATSDEQFTVFNPILDDEKATEKIEKSRPTVSITDGFGNAMTYVAEVDGQDLLLKVKRNGAQTFGQDQTFIATYTSYALSSRNGALVDFYIPSFAENFPFNDENTSRVYDTVVRIPKSLGEINFSIPNKAAVDKGDYWELAFAQNELTGLISWIQIGTTQYYSFDIEQPYSATTTIPAFYNTYTVTLPRDVVAGPVTQKVYFEELSPSPDRVFTDDLGNLIAEFSVPGDQSGTIRIKGWAIVTKDNKVAISDSGTKADIPENIRNIGTRSADFWESDAGQIRQVANQLVNEVNSDDVYKLISRTYQYVVDKIDYSEVKRFGLNTRQGALLTLAGGAAVCMEYSDLFIALMRAAGVPARAAFGYGYDSRATSGVDTAHQWAEVYIPKLDQWVGVDTTWGENGPAIIGGDLNHLYRHVAVTDPNTPAQVSVQFFGQSPNGGEEKFTILAQGTAPETSDLMSQEAALQEYSTGPDSTAQLQRSLSYFLSTINSKFESSLNDAGIKGTANAALRIVIVTAPLWLAAILILLSILRARHIHRHRAHRHRPQEAFATETITQQVQSPIVDLPPSQPTQQPVPPLVVPTEAATPVLPPA